MGGKKQPPPPYLKKVRKMSDRLSRKLSRERSLAEADEAEADAQVQRMMKEIREARERWIAEGNQPWRAFDE